MVKVKVEKVSDNSSDDDEDNDEDNDTGAGHGTGHGDAARTARAIYKKAYKILKLKLYFENFFPADEEKDSLPQDCWTSAVASIAGKIDGGPAATERMFHDFGYDKQVRALPGVPSLARRAPKISPHL